MDAAAVTGFRESFDLSTYLVTDSGQAKAAGHDLVDLVYEAVAGGVTIVQLREKDMPAREFLDLVLRVSTAVARKVPVLVNDRVDVYLAAREMGAKVAGVHVGQGDLPSGSVRALVGPHAIVGLSAATEDQLYEASVGSAGVDYVGIGALHPTTTKKDAPESLGHERMAELMALSTLPAVAIGGVGVDDLALLRAGGADGAAVVSAICGAADPREAARALAAAWAGVVATDDEGEDA
ncbi:thiamine-phosphate diphosphorylase [Salinibacterium amurskyense]|uniref:Thiamine-phosphate synthase n=1 Tax=Salinibacterium amurskyense TaxID=205941 RepID=A0A2M9DA53_9MICO|nr:thiamine phosphate synthase [Salinibacterium amurskyense]PJJ82611.1 thiamine-phosphate diphosphorylase [Salinibacterium amurskyense]RLQ82336.1 thiamine phosphate synthase [Salinibacterium amurskyense]GHD76332.1 thiamine-phosphate synthase [Salinibacterium amurskyense]